MDGEKKKVRFSIGYLIVAFWAVLLLQQVFSAYLQPARTSYSDFKAAVDSGRDIELVLVGRPPRWFARHDRVSTGSIRAPMLLSRPSGV